MSDDLDLPQTPCATCKRPTCDDVAVARGGLCDACWQVESRLASYLRRGGDTAEAKLMGVIMARKGHPRDAKYQLSRGTALEASGEWSDPQSGKPLGGGLAGPPRLR